MRNLVRHLWQTWLYHFRPTRAKPTKQQRNNAWLGLELLEDRALPSGFNLVDPHPQAGDGFGADVVPLANGNIVVTAPDYDAGAVSDAGAVYLFNGSNGQLISSLFGSNKDDNAGSGGIVVLTNGNYVVSSPDWSDYSGAVTFGNGTTGVSGAVTATNSLVGSTSGDGVGDSGVTALTNGDYVVESPNWNDYTGAATFGSGATGVSGLVSATNSLVGSTSGDEVGNDGVTALTNGNYVVASSEWNDYTGAATFGSGATGVSGLVSTTNSLVGSSSEDKGYVGVTALTNGNYVVDSPYWDDSVGAITFGDGTTGIVGAISASNSLIGSTSGDFVGGDGGGGVTALTNGNYVVSSPDWSDYSGAVTFSNGTTGVSGFVSASNSLVGSASDDSVGAGGVTALTNGNYVVSSPDWDDNLGAVTFGSGTTGVSGFVSASNSLVGSTSGDYVGAGAVSNDGVTALTNGNYVVASPYWNDSIGAVTFGSGTTGVNGVVSASNSLVGSASDDSVGAGGVTALTNGNYVVVSFDWNDYTGAATFGSGTTGITGVVSATNSLVGSTSGDYVGSSVTALTNGNYVVDSSNWNDSIGAVTFGNGVTGISGAVSATNSLVGSTSGDYVGSAGAGGDGGVTALPNGNYVVASPAWNDGTGAATFGSSATGVSGVVSASNSLVGTKTDSGMGDVVVDQENGDILIPFTKEGLVIDSPPGALATSALSLGSLGQTQWNVNQPGYDSTIAVTGGTGKYAGLQVTGLPPGLSAALSGSTITISGTPTECGTFADIVVSLHDSGETPATQTYSLTINAVLTQYENATPAVVTGKSLLGNNFSGFGGTKSGLAVTGTDGAGTWQYFNGSTWKTISGVSDTNALLMPAADSLRFVPTANASGQADLDFLAWNGSVGTAGGSFNPTGSSAFSPDAGSLTITVNPVPLWEAATVTLPAIANKTTPAGSTVMSIFGADFHDDNNAVIVGVAIVAATGTADGKWEYSTDGNNWTNFWAVSTGDALLLSEDDLIRFVPNASFTGNVTATLKAYAWDGTGTTAVAGATKGFRMTATGGASGFSTTLLTVSCLVNDAPVLAATTGPTLLTATEGVASKFAVSILITGGQITDPNTGALKGIAIVGIGGANEWPGTWQYSLNGTTWSAFQIPPSESSAFLLPSTASLRFVSTVQVDTAATTEPATLTYHAWDETAGTAGMSFTVTAPGGATSISSAETTASMTVNFANHAPTWTGSAISLPAEQSESTPAGSSVTSIFNANFNDVDGDLVGVAIVAATGTADGTWEYSINGTAWTNFWAVSTSNALLLSADDLICFLPNGSFMGNVTATLKAYAWDGTPGTAAAAAGATAGFRITSTGGATAFSPTLLTVSCLVNDAPVLAATTGPTLPSATEGIASRVAVSTLITDAQISDPNPGALKGIAIVDDGAGDADEWPGTWQYSLNNVTWINLPSVSESSAFLLPSTASLRFVSTIQVYNATTTNPATLTYRAWDETAGTAEHSLAVTTTGGATSISTAELTASMAVSFVNHAPTWTTTRITLPTQISGSTPAGTTVQSIFGSAFSDVDGNPAGIAVVGATSAADGTWQYSIDDGNTWTPIIAPSAANAWLLSASDLVRFVPKATFVGTATLEAYAWDGTGDTAAASASATKGFKIPAHGGASAFSTTLLTVSVEVT